MTEIELYNKIEELEKKGYYLRAISLIDNNFVKIKNFEKPFFEIKKNSLSQNHNTYYHTDIGEALFPVINESTNENFLAKIKLVKEESINDNILLEKIKDSIKKAFNLYLNEPNIFKKNHLRFFEWNLPDYSVTVFNQDKNINIKDISGSSYELALTAAYISIFLDIPIKQNIVFSGVVQNENIKEVDYIERKFNLIKDIFIKDFTFVCNSELPNTQKTTKIKELFDFAFEDSIYDKLYNNKNKIDNYFALNFIQKTFENSKKAKIDFYVADFQHSNLNQNYIKETFNYLNTIRELIQNNNTYCKNLIISGIRPNYYLGYLIIPLFNHIKNTLALTNTQLPNDKYAVIILSKNSNDFSLGDLI